MATSAPPPDALGSQLFQARLKANDFVQEHLKTIVTVASGTLVLTVSFVKDVVGAGEAAQHLTWLLAVSWGALGAAVFCGTFGLATLVNNLDDADTNVDKANVPVAFAAGKSGIVLRWEVLSIFLFGSGMLALALFGALNYRLFLQRKATTDKPAFVLPPPAAPARHFAMVSSPEHQAGSLRRHSHTFLLDQTTGQVWQTVCSREGMVSFRKITVEGIQQAPTP